MIVNIVIGLLIWCCSLAISGLVGYYTGSGNGFAKGYDKGLKRGMAGEIVNLMVAYSSNWADAVDSSKLLTDIENYIDERYTEVGE